MEEESFDSHSVRNMTWMIYFFARVGGEGLHSKGATATLPSDTPNTNDGEWKAQKTQDT